jgi:hypothetical protein
VVLDDDYLQAQRTEYRLEAGGPHPFFARDAVVLPQSEFAPAPTSGSWADPFGTSIASIFQASNTTQGLLDEIGDQLGVKARNGTLMRMLLKRDLITPDLLELYNTLRLGRNAVAHDGAPLPNEAEILEFVRQSVFLNLSLYAVLKKLKAEGSNK